MKAAREKAVGRKGKQVKRRTKGRPATKGGTRTTTKSPRSRSQSAELAGIFGNAAGRFGVGLGIVVEARQGDEIVRDTLCVSSFGAKPGQRPRSRLLGLSDPVDAARVVAGFAHPDRIRLARAMAIGACTHEALSKAVPLKTGPLYHHLRELERAGISKAVARNTYGLTDVGQLVLFVISGLGTAAAKTLWKHKAIRGQSRD